MSPGERNRVTPGDRAPNFVAPSTEGDVEFHGWKGGSWALLIAHPDKCSPVLVTELLALARLQEHFERRDAKLLCVSADPLAVQKQRRVELESLTGVGLGFPLVGDSAGSVAAKYGITATGSPAARTILVVDPEHRVRLALPYPESVGAGFGEILRLLDALRLADRFRVHTPAEWRPGSRVIVAPELDDETAGEYFGGFDAHPGGLRMMDDPGA